MRKNLFTSLLPNDDNWLEDKVTSLIHAFPIEQWWRLFIDGYRQYSFSDKKFGNESVRRDSFACESFEITEPGYITSCLFAFLTLLENISKPLTLNLIQETHANATKRIDCFGKKNPGEFRGTNSSVFIRLDTHTIDPKFASNYTTEGIRELEKDSTELGLTCFYDRRDNTPLAIFSPEKTTDEMNNLVNNIIQTYEETMRVDKTNIEKIRIIVQLIQKFERLHPFKDGNCRTFCMLILNRELIKHNLDPVIMYDPNCFDGFSMDQVVNEILHGQKRFRQVRDSSGKSEICMLDFQALSEKNGGRDCFVGPNISTILQITDAGELNCVMKHIIEAVERLPLSSKVRAILSTNLTFFQFHRENDNSDTSNCCVLQ